jgi:hypothetical protein
MTLTPQTRAGKARLILLPFKVFVCAGWIAADALFVPILAGYALSTVILAMGGVVQRFYRRRDESLVTFAAAIVGAFILWRLLPTLAK